MSTRADRFRHRQIAAGLVNVEPALVPGAGHFTQVEAPEETWRLIAGFAARWQAL